jgi:hypothetical protein
MSSFFYVIVLHVVAWIYGWVIQEKYTANPPVLDWKDKGFTEGFFVLLLWGMNRHISSYTTAIDMHQLTRGHRILAPVAAKLDLLSHVDHDGQYLRAW